QPPLVRRVAFVLRRRDREHHVAMGVVDREHALGAGHPDLEAVNRARPGHRQRPGNVEVIDAAVGEHDHAGGGVDALVGGSQNLVDRARVAFDRVFASMHHITMSSAWVPEITIGEIAFGSSVRLLLSMATSLFLKARGGTRATSPSAPPRA